MPARGWLQRVRHNTYTVCYVRLVADHHLLVVPHSPRPAHLIRTVILHNCHHAWCSHEGRRRRRARAGTWSLGAGRISAEAVLLVRKIRSVVDGNLVAGCDGLRQHQDRLTHRCRTVVAVRVPCENRVCLFARLVVRQVPGVTMPVPSPARLAPILEF